MSDVYQKLAHHLDRLPGGFPPTESGVELRILKRLFDPQEAELATSLQMMPEPVSAIAERVGADPDEIAPTLEEMSRKGLIFRMKKDGQTVFMAAQFVIGIWEYHVNDLDEELIKDFNEYVPYLTDQNLKNKTQQLRVIPISQSVDATMQVMPYEAAEEIVRQQSKIIVAPCICRREHAMVGKGCDKPQETCLVFGGGAHFYEENGLGRDISPDEAVEILKKGEEHGLVLQPGNAQKPMNICMCCGCCCQILKNLNHLPQPAKAVANNYYAVVDEDACVACGVCEERCQMGAVTINEVAEIDLDRCIGCGLCVTTCETEAITLAEKEQKTVPPKNIVETYMNIAMERGLFG